MFKKSAITLFFTLFVIFTGNLVAQQIIYEEYFTNGSTDLEWQSAGFDSVGTPITPMEVENQPGNPSGDGWVGTVTGNIDILGGWGCAYAGDFSLTDYSVEAEVFVSPTNVLYDAIMVRVDTTGGVLVGYQMAANFNTMMGASRIRLRRYYSTPDSIVILAEWEGNDIPGGPPTEDEWHTMQLSVEGNELRCFWDRQELSGGPYIDNVFASGPFGAYVFDNIIPSQILIDDIIVRSIVTGIDEPGDEITGSLPKAFVLGQIYPNPFNPSTVISLKITTGENGKIEHVRLSVFDLRGREVRKLIDRPLETGSYQVHWDGRDSAGRSMSSGVYMYRLERGGEAATQKMILTR